jgi:malonate transporter and related proteins
VNHVFEIVLPVFGICLIGYLSITLRLLTVDSGDALARYVFVIAVPALLFRNMATGAFDAGHAMQLWIAYFGGVALTWAVASIIIRIVFKRDYKASIIAGIAASFANTVMIGIPLVQRAYGEEMTQVLFLILSIHLPVMLLVASLLVEYAAFADDPAYSFDPVSTATRVIRNLATNAIVIGLIAGTIWRIAALPYGGPPASIINLLGQTAGPLALFCLGISLHKYGIASNFKQASVVTALSLLFMPAAVYVIGLLLPGLPPAWLKVALMTAACPTGVNAYLFATHFKTAEGLSSNAIMMTTAFGAITISLWLAVAATL